MEIFYRRDSSGVVDVHSLDGVSTGQVAAVVHPTFLYELLWNLLVFAFLLYIDRKYRLGHGRLFALYIASYCVGRFWVELMRDDTATHIAGIRINVFTAGFVFIGAVVYMLLAPKGREDPATLRGREPDDERAVEELAGELAAVAKGSGILAAVTVAGDHEQEDAEAVGDDIGADSEVGAGVDADAEFLAEVESEESATEVALEDEIVESGFANADVTADVTADEAALVIEAEPATDAEQDVLDEVESAMVIGDDDAVDEQAEIAEDDGPVVVYASAPDSETVVVYDSSAEDDADDVEATVEVEHVEVVEAEVVPEVVVEAEAEPEVVVEAEAEVVVKPESEAEPEAVVETESHTEVVLETEPEPETAGFGSTLRRLLWGVGSKGGD
jgi:hypothetical protein